MEGGVLGQEWVPLKVGVRAPVPVPIRLHEHGPVPDIEVSEGVGRDRPPGPIVLDEPSRDAGCKEIRRPYRRLAMRLRNL